LGGFDRKNHKEVEEHHEFSEAAPFPESGESEFEHADQSEVLLLSSFAPSVHRFLLFLGGLLLLSFDLLGEGLLGLLLGLWRLNIRQFNLSLLWRSILFVLHLRDFTLGGPFVLRH
jgi:hypothetical protein